MTTFQSVYADQMTEFIHLQRGLGYRFRSGALLLQLFDRFLAEQGHLGPLTRELGLAFATRNPANSPQYQAALYHTAKRFSEYLAVFDPMVRPLDPVRIRPVGRPRPPHIYTDSELQRVLEETHRYAPQHPFRGFTLRMIIGLAASTGLRIGEVVRLNDMDLDFTTGTLTLHHTKFNKHRLVPPHPTALEALHNYRRLRDLLFPVPHCEALFVNHGGERFSTNSLRGAIRKLVRRANILRLNGGYPTFHHLRHTFAVKRLVAWYHEGLDVQALLPVLATYLGHVGYSETAYYLAADPELLGLARAKAQGITVPCESQP